MPEKEKIEKPYLGYHQSLRKSSEQSGFRRFSDYEVLELQLSFVIPRKDTKPIARALLWKSKAFPAFLSADNRALQKIKGIKERIAQFIKAFY